MKKLEIFSPRVDHAFAKNDKNKQKSLKPCAP